MKLTTQQLKQESHNFDLECVYVLDLSRKGIRDLGDLKECVNLELLNLSNNEINDLMSLSSAKMLKLQYLDLSFNQIKYLNGVESLESLRTLNLSGNHLDSYEEFYKLRNLENLQQLTLSDSKTTSSNPICTSRPREYRSEISRILPRLELIDGESFKQNGKNLFKSLDDTLRQTIIETSSLSESFDLSICSEPWLTYKQGEQVSSSKSNLKSIDFEQNQREKFIYTYEKLTNSMKESADYLQKLEKEFKQ